MCISCVYNVYIYCIYTCLQIVYIKHHSSFDAEESFGVSSEAQRRASHFLWPWLQRFQVVIAGHALTISLSKEVWKSNFRQYGEMKKQSAGRRVRREKIRRKKMQAREKVGKSRNTVFFRGFVAPEGWKVGSLKRRVRRHLGRWEMKSCTPLWREAHLEVKCVKNWGVRTTFGSWDVKKVHAVVARRTFRSQNVQNTP